MAAQVDGPSAAGTMFSSLKPRPPHNSSMDRGLGHLSEVPATEELVVLLRATRQSTADLSPATPRRASSDGSHPTSACCSSLQRSSSSGAQRGPTAAAAAVAGGGGGSAGGSSGAAGTGASAGGGMLDSPEALRSRLLQELERRASATPPGSLDGWLGAGAHILLRHEALLAVPPAPAAAAAVHSAHPPPPPQQPQPPPLQPPPQQEPQQQEALEGGASSGVPASPSNGHPKQSSASAGGEPQSAGCLALGSSRPNAVAVDGGAGGGCRSPSPSPRNPAHPCTFLSPPPAPFHGITGTDTGAPDVQHRTRSTSISTTAASTAGSTTAASSYVSISSFAASASASASSSAPRPVGLLSAHLRHAGHTSADSAPATATGLRHGTGRGGNGSGCFGPAHLAEEDSEAAEWMGMAGPAASSVHPQPRQAWAQECQDRGRGSDGKEAAGCANAALELGSGPVFSSDPEVAHSSRRYRSMSCTGSAGQQGGVGSSSCTGLNMMGSGGGSGVRASRSRTSLAGSGSAINMHLAAGAAASLQRQQQELELQKRQRRISQTVVASGPVPPLLALRQVLSGSTLTVSGDGVGSGGGVGGGAESLIYQREPRRSGGGGSGGGGAAVGVSEQVSTGAGDAARGSVSHGGIYRTPSRRSQRGDADSDASGLTPRSAGGMSPGVPLSPSFKHTAQSPPVHPAFALASPTPSPPLSPPPERVALPQGLATSTDPSTEQHQEPLASQARGAAAAAAVLLDDAVVITAVINSPVSTASGAVTPSGAPGAGAATRFGSRAEKPPRGAGEEPWLDARAAPGSLQATATSSPVGAGEAPAPQQLQQVAGPAAAHCGDGSVRGGSPAHSSPHVDVSSQPFGRISSPISASVGGRASLGEDAYISAVLGSCSLGRGSPTNSAGGDAEASAPVLTAPLAPHPMAPLPLQPPVRHGSYCTASAAAAAAAAIAYGSLMAETAGVGCGSSSDGGKGVAATAAAGFSAGSAGAVTGRQHAAPQRSASSGVSAFAAAAVQRQQLLPRQPVFGQPLNRGAVGSTGSTGGKPAGSESPFACLCRSPLVFEGTDANDQSEMAKAGAGAVCETCSRPAKGASSRSSGNSRRSGGAKHGGGGTAAVTATSAVNAVSRGTKETRPVSKPPAAGVAIAPMGNTAAPDIAAEPDDAGFHAVSALVMPSVASASVTDSIDGTDVTDSITAAISDARRGSSGSGGSGLLTVPAAAAAGRSASEASEAAVAASAAALMMGDITWPRAVRYSGAMSIGDSRSSSVGLAPGLSLSMGLGRSNASDGVATDYFDAAIAAATGAGPSAGSAFSSTSAAAAAAVAAAASATGRAGSPISHLHRSPRYLWGVSPDDTTLMRALGDGGLGPCAHLTIWSSSRLGSRMGSLLPASSLAGGMGGGGSLYGSLAGASAMPSFANGSLSRSSLSGSPATLGGGFGGGGGGAFELDFVLPQREGPPADGGSAAVGGAQGGSSGADARPRSASGRQRRSQQSSQVTTPTAAAQATASALPPRPLKQAAAPPNAPATATAAAAATVTAATALPMGAANSGSRRSALAPPRQVRWQQRLACVAGGHSASEAEEEEARAAAAADVSAQAACSNSEQLQAALAAASISQLLAALAGRLVVAVLAAPSRLMAAVLLLLLSWVTLAASGSRAVAAVVLDRTARVLYGLGLTAPAPVLAATARALAGTSGVNAGAGAGTGGSAGKTADSKSA